MATIIRYVNTASSGGDGTTNNTSGGTAAYASLSAAEAALRQTLTGVTNDVNDQDGANTISLRIYVQGSAADTTAVVFSNASWVTDATHRIEVILNGTTSGAKWDTAIYRLSGTPGYGTGALTVGKALHMDFINLQVENTTNEDNNPKGLQLGNFAWDVRVYGGYYRVPTNDGSGWDNAAAICVDATGAHSLKMRNVTAVAADGFGFNNPNYSTNVNAHLWVYNCTFINRSADNRTVFEGVNYDTQTTNRLKNLLIQGAGTSNYTRISPDEEVSILTQDTTAPGTGLDSKTVSFVDATNWDYHLASDDTAAKDAGTDLSADANWPFSTDGDGVARTGTWDIGADEYVAVASENLWAQTCL